MTINDELAALSKTSAELMRSAEHAIERGDYELALDAYNKVMAEESTGYVFAKRGYVKYEIGDFEGAISDFDQAVLLRPSSPTTLRYRAKSKEAKGDLSGALSDYRLSLEYSDRAETHCDMAMILEFQEHRQRAIEEYAIALSLDPNNKIAKAGIATLSAES